MKAPLLVLVALVAALSGNDAHASATPQTVSPGGTERVARAADRCPTFSWGAVPEAVKFRLAVYDATEETGEPQLVVSEELPGSVSSWTPSLESCLLPGRLYAWRIGAVDAKGEVTWSSPSWFEVEPQMLELPSNWVEQVVERLTLTRQEEPQAGSGTAAREPRVPVPSQTASRMARAASTFSVGNSGSVTAGAVSATSFAGDGSAVTNVDAATLQGNTASAFAASAHAHDDRYYTEAELATGGGGGAVHWNNLTSVPEGFADGVDNDTTYTAGTGLALAGTQFSLASVPNSHPGHTLTTLDSTGHVGRYTSVTVGADDLGLISYYDDTNLDLKVAHCSDVNCTSATLTTLDSAGTTGLYTSVAVGADGLGLISYFDGTNGDLKAAHCSDVNCTSATLTALDSTGNVGDYTSVTVGADGLGLISYHDWTNHDLKVAHCSNVNCTSATLTTLDSTEAVGACTSVTVGADGLGLISYYDATNGDLKVAHCSDVNCTSATLSTLDSTGDVGTETSVTVGADGLGLISYHDGSNFDLKVAHCSNVNCTSATITTLDSSGHVGFYTSVTVGADGLGLISYHDASNPALKVAHCSDVNCTSATITTLDSAGYVGYYTSVTVGADGLGLISYCDSTNWTLKVAHCAITLSVPHFRRR